ncbi:PREDICTED: CMRF35-like molecule 1 isoform X2 [Chinchilla lanigera]|uniref:CMRF35-like molecule 1 isoform X2 n=1 Tax=Chinchilla lanigera TaxID=34839 RepID=UPI00069917EB|nr:PREDICTED: CMRF35-like molecule 1 isoform X2 [Chinchilla lanigera]
MYLLLFFPLFFWFSGFSAAQKDITGPNAVSGQERGSLTVQCRYTSKWKTSRKWWCRGAAWSSCKIQIQTDGSEKEQKKERLSIRDYQKELMFRVTLEDLRRDDADNYWCGIERFGTDPGLKVKVTVVPVSTTTTTTTSTTSVSTMNTFTAPVTAEENISLLSPTIYHFSGRYGITNLSILLPLIFAVLLLLLVVASLLAWRMRKQQKKAAALSSEQPVEGDICYANLSLHQSGTFPGSSQQKASTKSSSAQADQGEVEYVTMAPSWRQEISYASLCLDILNQEPTYSNTGHAPRRGCEDSTEYTSIRRP